MSDHKVIVQYDAARIDAIFRHLDQGRLPGAAVGIAIDGRPVYRKGFGLANMELPVTLTPSVRMRICSVTKHFTAFAYMLLCEEGRAAIDDPVEKYLPELHPANHGVTMRQLMGNIGGLRDAQGICWHLSGMEAHASSADLLSLYRTIDDVNFAPGTSYSYNNGGFLMLGVAIERITGEALEDVLRTRIFEPLGMYDSLLRRSDTDFVANSATTHAQTPTGEFTKFLLGSAIAGEGGIVSTIDDMLRWLAHMDTPRLGSSATWATMRTSQVLRNGTSTGYGLGLSVGRYRGVETLSHPGGWVGGNAQMLKVPAAGLDIVILVNRQDAASTLLGNQILDVCLPGLEPMRAASQGPFARGTFLSRASGRVVRLNVKDGQQIASVDGMDMLVEPDRSGALRPVGLMGFLKQSVTLIGDPTQPTAVRFDDFGNVEELSAVGPGNERDGREIVGRYRSEGTATDAVIFAADGKLQLRTIGRFGSISYDLECIAERVWLTRATMSVAQWSGTLSFAADNRSFQLSNWSNRALAFKRIS